MKTKDEATAAAAHPEAMPSHSESDRGSTIPDRSATEDRSSTEDGASQDGRKVPFSGERGGVPAGTDGSDGTHTPVGTDGSAATAAPAGTGSAPGTDRAVGLDDNGRSSTRVTAIDPDGEYRRHPGVDVAADPKDSTVDADSSTVDADSSAVDADNSTVERAAGPVEPAGASVDEPATTWGRGGAVPDEHDDGSGPEAVQRDGVETGAVDRDAVDRDAADRDAMAVGSGEPSSPSEAAADDATTDSTAVTVPDQRRAAGEIDEPEGWREWPAGQAPGANDGVATEASDGRATDAATTVVADDQVHDNAPGVLVPTSQPVDVSVDGANAGRPTPDHGKTIAELLPGDAAERLRQRWRDLQLRFVDNPHNVAEEADFLVGEAIEALTGALANTRGDLSRWRSDGTGDTEQLRLAVQRYREFLDRILTL
jgi:hypothetical protein